MRAFRWHPAGDRGVLLEIDDAEPDWLRGVAAILEDNGSTHAVIIGHSSILLLLSSGVSTKDLDALIHRSSGEIERRARSIPHHHEIPVNFSPEAGPDLEEFLRSTGIDLAGFLGEIRSVTLTARYLGFLAGFAYLEGLPRAWHTPRRARARTRVPAGSFGIAGSMAGFYPVSSPGGWNLLGRTSLRLWKPDDESPNLISPGDRIRIVPSDEPILEVDHAVAVPRALEGSVVARVLHPGQSSVVVQAPDLSRYRHGLSPGGAFDAALLIAANRAVGNPELAPALECAMVGPRLKFVEPAVVAWWGAVVRPRLNGREVAEPVQFSVRAGDELEVGSLVGGFRGVLAVQGGLIAHGHRHEAAPVRLRTGDSLRRGAPFSSHARIQVLDRDDRFVLRAKAGPHIASAKLLEVLRSRQWVVTTELDRVGVRLRAEVLDLELPAALLSCGMQFGTVQWHPGGELVIMGPDHPVTGGYLQPLTVLAQERWKIAQLCPGDSIRLEIE